MSRESKIVVALAVVVCACRELPAPPRLASPPVASVPAPAAPAPSREPALAPRDDRTTERHDDDCGFDRAQSGVQSSLLACPDLDGDGAPDLLVAARDDLGCGLAALSGRDGRKLFAIPPTPGIGSFPRAFAGPRR